MRMPKRIKGTRWIPIPLRSGDGVPGVAPAQVGADPDMENLVREILDPVLVPLGFAPAQVGGGGERGQVIFCRGDIDSKDGGCVDLVLDVEAAPDWRISDVRYWGFPSDRWDLDFDRGARLADQLAGLAKTLPSKLE